MAENFFREIAVNFEKKIRIFEKFPRAIFVSGTAILLSFLVVPAAFSQQRSPFGWRENSGAKNREIARERDISREISVAPIEIWPGNRPKNHVVFAEIPPLLRVVPAGDFPVLRLVPANFHSKEIVPENSSLARSSWAKNVFWTISDSSFEPRIFALRSDGKFISGTKNSGKKYRGILVSDRRNVDWEAIAPDGNGNLIIGDIGNNLSNRRNLCFYVVPEPRFSAEETAVSRKISFYYPTQNFFPDKSLNYDSEAAFSLYGNIYFFTKHWTNTETILWRVVPETEKYQAAVPVARFDARGMVTDAALSPDKTKLAVLTYHSIWIFSLPKEIPNRAQAAVLAGKIPATRNFEEKFFTSGTPRFRKISSSPKDWQREGIEFLDDENLIISAESGAIFVVPVEEIK